MQQAMSEKLFEMISLCWHQNVSILDFIGAKDDGGGGNPVTTGALRYSKLQSNRHHQQTIKQRFLQAGCPSCHSTNSVRPLKGDF